MCSPDQEGQCLPYTPRAPVHPCTLQDQSSDPFTSGHREKQQGSHLFVTLETHHMPETASAPPHYFFLFSPICLLSLPASASEASCLPSVMKEPHSLLSTPPSLKSPLSLDLPMLPRQTGTVRTGAASTAVLPALACLPLLSPS